MLSIELKGLRSQHHELPAPAAVRSLCRRAAAAVGVCEGHMAVEFVDAARIADLNARFRGRPSPTDVLSFPIDGAGAIACGPERELGDVVVCPLHCHDVQEAIVHGTLHLLGFDHEADQGEMLALQRKLLAPEQV